jgi:hypothetical protein
MNSCVLLQMLIHFQKCLHSVILKNTLQKINILQSKYSLRCLPFNLLWNSLLLQNFHKINSWLIWMKEYKNNDMIAD